MVQGLYAIVGTEGVSQLREEYRLGEHAPLTVVAPCSEAEVVALIQHAQGQRLPFLVAGGGTHLSYLVPPISPWWLMSTARLKGVVDYSPADLVITLRAGTTLAEAQQVLAEHHQYLPWNPPLPDQATIGGIVASNRAGSWRFRYGTPRDPLLAVRAVRGDGVAFKSGAKVVKSVAGYDLHRLLCGSWGTLTVLTEITLKVYPKPRVSRAVGWFVEWESLELTLEDLMRSPLRPDGISVVMVGQGERAGKATTVGVQEESRFEVAEADKGPSLGFTPDPTYLIAFAQGTTPLLKVPPVNGGNREEGKVPPVNGGNREEGKVPPVNGGHREESKVPLVNRGRREESKVPLVNGGHREESKVPLANGGHREESKVPLVYRADKGTAFSFTFGVNASVAQRFQPSPPSPLPVGEGRRLPPSPTKRGRGGVGEGLSRLREKGFRSETCKRASEEGSRLCALTSVNGENREESKNSSSASTPLARTTVLEPPPVMELPALSELLPETEPQMAPLAWEDEERPFLLLEFSGTEAGVEWQINWLIENGYSPQMVEVEPLRDLLAPRTHKMMVQLLVRPSEVALTLQLWQGRGVSAIAHAGNGVVYLWCEAEESISALIEYLHSTSAKWRVLNCPPEVRLRLPQAPLSQGERILMRKIKHALDPSGLLPSLPGL